MHAIRWPQPSDDRRWMCHVRYRGKIRAIWSTANATLPSERRMRLTSRDEGSGRGGGGKEEEGGVDELHFYLGLGVELEYQLLRL